MNNDTQTLTLTQFLLARIAEDEAAAKRAGSWGDGETPFENDNYGHLTVQPHRVLAECEAKRRIVELHPWGHEFGWLERVDGPLGGPVEISRRECETCGPIIGYREQRQAWPCGTLRALALVYADHPDYDAAWAI